MDYSKLKKAELVELLEKRDQQKLVACAPKNDDASAFVSEIITKQKASLVITKLLKKYNFIK